MAGSSPELQWAAQRGLFTANKANTDTYAGKGVQMAQNYSHSVCLFSCLVVKKKLAENKALFESVKAAQMTGSYESKARETKSENVANVGFRF